MPKGFTREIALLTAPVVAIAAVALWKSRPEPPVATVLRPKPAKSTPPRPARIHWQVVEVDPKLARTRLAFEAKSVSTVTARGGLPAGITPGAVGWDNFRVMALRVKRHGRWSALPIAPGAASIAGYGLTSSSGPLETASKRSHTLKCEFSLMLRGLPTNTQAVRLKLAMTGAAQYQGTWPTGVPLPAGVLVKGKGVYEEALASPPSEIEMKAVWFQGPGAMP